MSKKLVIIIMAGGLGKRMNSHLPKVLHNIGGKPMLVHIINQTFLLNPVKIFIVVGKFRGIIEETLSKHVNLDNIEFVLQEQALGTGHAIQCCRSHLLKYSHANVVILSGDTPFIQSTTIHDILQQFHTVKIVTTVMQNPYGYGRIIETCDGLFEKITEEKDCSSLEKTVQKVNCGIYAFDLDVLCKYLPLLTNQNAQQEYYLTDIIELIKHGEEIAIDLYNIPEERQIEITGVNTIDQLTELEMKWNQFL
uniref:UDP-N-acetylglucosamine diphosphorylase n=1 Tax=viral metagenome TaxID=1070528 RepID=A0A6C0E2B0_9ZZZZ